jgi:glycerophosphoryl diester phosphodiesterase
VQRTFSALGLAGAGGDDRVNADEPIVLGHRGASGYRPEHTLEAYRLAIRAENQFVPADVRIGTDPNARGDITAEYELFFGLGIDGVFADCPDTAVAARAGLPRT